MQSNLLLQLVAMSRFALFGLILQSIFSCMLIAGDLHAQWEKKSIEDIYLSMEADNLRITDVFQTISNKTGFSFAYNEKLINLRQRISLQATNASLADILREISKTAELKFKRVNEYIHVGKLEKNEKNTVEEKIVSMNINISGQVTSEEEGEGLPGVNVLVKGTSTGTVTDMNGNYKIEVPNAETVLVFSSIGFLTEEIVVGNQTVINVSMVPDVKALEEIVVVGYGTQKKKDLTGAVVSMSNEKVEDMPVSNLGSALQGNLPGVDVIQGDGSPGSSPKIRIRGANSISGGNDPLYVVDGYPLSGGLGMVNPNDIVSIEVLKDASAAAIYGSRGANGVIIITTKKGEAGQPKFTFDAYTGFNAVTNRPKLLNAEQFITIVNEAYTNDGNPPRYTEPLSSYGDTDWQDEILQTGVQQNYQLSVSGGNDNTRFYLSGNYFKEEGIVKNTDFNRLNLNFNIDTYISDKFKLGANVILYNTNDNAMPTRQGGSVDRGGVVSTALLVPPIVPVYDADGNYVFEYEDYIGQNPVSMVNELKNESSRYTGIGSFFGEYEIFEGLQLKVLVGSNVNFHKRDSYQPSNTFTGSAQNGIASVSQSQNYEWLNENTLNYSRIFGDDHSVNLLLGYTQQYHKNESISGSASDFITDAFLYNSLESGNAPGAPQSGASDWALRSYIGRINYIFKDKYLITATARYDGSSRFGKDNKYGFFPSGSVAWRLSEEEFLKQSTATWINDLKLRVSYGFSGNQAVPSYGSLSSLTASSNFGYIFGGQANIGVGPSSIGNPGLEWEKTKEWNIGLDFLGFDNKLGITLDYYIKTTEDLLLNINLPNHTGFSSTIANVGSVENRGLEVALNYEMSSGKLTWNTGLNLTANRNKIIELGESNDILLGGGFVTIGLNDYSILREGEAMGSFYGFYHDGIYQSQEQIDELGHQPNASPGDIIYRDINGDGSLNADDRAIIGHANPDYMTGFNNFLNFGNFDLNIFMVGYFGMDRLNVNQYALESLNGEFNMLTTVLDRWTPENPGNLIPRATREGHSYRVDTRIVEDATFIRLRNITFGYTLPATLAERLKLSKARLYFSGLNLLTFTGFSGFDPEIGTTSDTSPGSDFDTYPRQKTFVVGLKLGF